MKSLIFFIAIVLLVSCKKAEERACIKNAGGKTTLELALPDFEKLHIGPKLEVVLIQDTVNKLVIEGRKNLVNLITADINEDGYLVIKNNNKCDFIRSYKNNKITLKVHFVQLYRLHFEGTEDLTTQGIINTSTFAMDIQEGGATAYLNINCTDLFVNQGYGYGNFVLSGNCTNAKICVISNGYGDSKGLSVSNNLIVLSDSPVFTPVNAGGAKTSVQINNSGDVMYIGTPASLELVQYGTGQLINGN